LNEQIKVSERRRRQNAARGGTASRKKAHSQEENNAEKKVGAIASKSIALLGVLATAYLAMAQDAKTTDPNVAPIRDTSSGGLGRNDEGK
jgi:hypothetical protein